MAKNHINGIEYSSIKSKGITYIKNQRNYLILNALVSFIAFFVSIINLIFQLYFLIIINQVRDKPFPFRPNAFSIIDSITPIVIMFILFIFLLFHYYFLLKWKKLVNAYEDQKSTTNEGEVTLIEMIYSIIDIMDRIKKIFLGLNVLFILYFQWFFRYFFNAILAFTHPTPIFPSYRILLPAINVLFQIVLIIYITINWKHFMKWNKKLNKIRDLEKEIYNELGFDQTKLIISGSSDNLKKIQNLIKNSHIDLIEMNLIQEPLNHIFDEEE